MIDSHAADLVGFVGAVIVLAGFGYQTVRNSAPNLVSNGLNFLGASLLALSLIVNYNLPALVLELAWAAIALIGLGRLLVSRR
jgi:hypothetical protein